MVYRHKEYRPEHDVRETPPGLFAVLNGMNDYTIDACALPQNAKCHLFYAPDGLRALDQPEPILTGIDGLTGIYTGLRVFANVPFSQFELWLPWAWKNNDAEHITMIAPGVRGDQPWWQQWVEPYRDERWRRHTTQGSCPASVCTDHSWQLSTWFMPGRIDFLEDGHPIWQRDKTGEIVRYARGPRAGQPKHTGAMFGIVILEWNHA